MAKGTLWGAYNAVTEFVDDIRMEKKDDSLRLKFIWFGSEDFIKKQAFMVASEMSN